MLWKRRFEEHGLDGLVARHRGSKPTVRTPKLQARILAWTRRDPPHGATHWSTRSLARKLKVQHTIIARAWHNAGLQPPRLERYRRSTDPDFETKAADVIGLYLDPPQHAVVFCIDENPAIQALDRVAGPRHTSDEFVAFLQLVVDSQAHTRAIHLIVDNLSAHKTKKVRDFLADHPTVHLHFTPTYSSWLNQVELWFSKIERDVIACGIFTSVPDLRRKLMRYIKHYNTVPKPFRWAYADPSKRIA